jgi:elongator complex protein 3
MAAKAKTGRRNMAKADFFSDIAGELAKKRLSKIELSNLKIKLSKKHGLARIPTDFAIALGAGDARPGYSGQLQSKPGRTGSGVAVVAIMTKPADCPHGRCTYCPGGVKSAFGDMPQSYTGKEPATLRGIRNGYDSYLQVFNRLEQYTILGHSYDKVELIIMGGTFISLPKKYRDEFVAYALKAMNDFSRLFYRNSLLDFGKFKQFFGLPGDIADKQRAAEIRSRLMELKGKADLLKEQRLNETARIRCVAMCIETRPDYCLEPHIAEMLRLGTTRVEMGVQTLDNRVLEKVERGHTVEDSMLATQLLKDSFLKVGYHMMPGLPKTSVKHDLEMLKQLFSDPAFRPDALKLYPCMVMPGTKLHDDYKQGRYRPLSTAKAAELIAGFKGYVPEYCRIMRVQRDIPSYVVEAGVDRTNLRQYVDRIMQAKKLTCRCIRCREPKGRAIDLKNLKLKAQEYASSGGTDIFISAEDPKKDLLAGFCRLRIPFQPFRAEIIPTQAGKVAGIRELHVYGELVPLGEKGAVQHHGIGKRLVAEAERLAREQYGMGKIAITSGIGVRQYYRKLGYHREGPYMSKNL